jgi:hypothetical protein
VLEIKAQYGIVDNDIYNFDETRFAMGSIATTKVVTTSDMLGKPQHLEGDNRQWVTVIEYIGANTQALPPLIIFKGKHIFQGWLDDLLHGWRIKMSKNGWTTNEIGLNWLQETFEPFSKMHTKGQYRMLVLDGHGSHISPEFDRYCIQNKIIPVCMPPHSSHLLQPLDVTCFSVLKRAYGAQIQGKLRQNIHHIDKFEFLEIYPLIWQETFKSTTICLGFSATGLVLYDPSRIMDKLHIDIYDTPTPPGSRGSNSDNSWSPKTPHNAIQLRKQYKTIERMLRRHRSPSTPTKDALSQVIKKYNMTLHSAVFLAQEVEELRAANESLQKRLRKSRQRVVPESNSTVQTASTSMVGSTGTEEVVKSGNATPLPEPLQASIRRPPKCSECGQVGHKRNKCPNLANI